MIQVPVPHGPVITQATATIWINPLQVERVVASWEYTRDNPWPSEEWVEGVEGLEGWTQETKYYMSSREETVAWRRRNPHECRIIWVGQSQKGAATTVKLPMDQLARELDAWFRSIRISRSSNG